MESRADAPAERRRAPRKEVDAPISFCTDDGQLWHSGRVRDLSILGVRLQSREPVEIGQHIIIAPPDSSAYAVHGTVVWKRMFHPSHFERIYEAGVEFSDQISDIENRIY
ncbi:MAG TPA: PilZ domain-containing protein, partial [bacterium]|nr:PilZ domain-containing protein [bacterium]